MIWEPRYEDVEGGGFRISQSSLESYLRCGLLYEFQRTDPTRRATIAQMIGTAVSGAACKDNRAKIAGGYGLPARELVEAAVSEYEDDARTSEIDAGRLEIAQGKDDTAGAAIGYATQLSGRISGVVLAEDPITDEVLPGLTLVGKPDVVTQTAIRDTKTGQPWTQERADRSRQLTGYDLLHRSTDLKRPVRLAIDSLFRRGSGGPWVAATFYTTRSEADRSAFRETLRRARDAILAGVALPAPERAWWCSLRWCPYARRCPVFPGRKE